MGAIFKPEGYFLREPGGAVFRPVWPGGEDASTAAYFAAYASPPASEPAYRAAVDAYVRGLKADGLWPKLLRLSLLANVDDNGAKIDLRNPEKAMTWVNSPTFTKYLGVNSDGATSYVHFGETAAAMGAAQDDFGASCYVGPTSGGAQRVLMGVSSGGGLQISGATTTSGPYNVSDSANATVAVSPPVGRRGTHTAVRTGATARAKYQNGDLMHSDAAASTGLPNGGLCGFRHTSSYGLDRLAMVAIHAGLDATQAANLHARTHALMTAIGAQAF